MLLLIVFLSLQTIFSQTQEVLSGEQPLVFTSLGNGVYNKSVIYNNSTFGFKIDLAKVSDDINSNPIDFRIDARGGLHPFFTIKGETGNVGVGTSIPDSKLTIKGNIHAEEVKVDLSVPAPDYVFKKDYKLKTLEETQKYINENGHLPNIPSAKEFEENGVELGVMNMKLLEKIEELTLYALDQEKHLKKQNTILLKQKKEIDYIKSVLEKLLTLEGKN